MGSEDIFSEVNLLWMARYDYFEGWTLSPHAHENYYQLIYILDGTAYAVVDGHSFHLKPDSLLYIPPKTIHSISLVGKAGLKTIDVKFEIHGPQLVEEAATIPFFVLDPPPGLGHVAIELHDEAEHKDYGYQWICRLHLAQMLILLIRSRRPSIHRSEQTPQSILPPTDHLSIFIIRLIALIENNYRLKISATDYEEACHCSYRYLSICSKKELGLSPKALLDHYRIHMAKQQLGTTERTIKEIATESGYSDIHQFSRAFRRIAGVTPASYRRQQEDKVWKDIKLSTKITNINHTRRNGI